MKFSYWMRGEYASEDGQPQEWPTPGRLWDPARGAESTRRALELADRAVAAGFDMVSAAEHHYGYSSLIPSPTLMAMALANRYSDVKIGILGPVLPLSNPVRVAEEIAMVDMVSGGRTVVGFFRGVASEQVVYGNNPGVTADMFREAFALVLHAWTEPETFGWEGRNYRFRMVSAFPRPLQQPHPPIVQSASSAESAAWTGSSGYMLGIFGPTIGGRAAEIAASYREARAAAGEPAAPEDILYRARVYVADSDEQAEADIERYGIGNIQGWMTPAPARAAAAASLRRALMSGSAPAGRGSAATQDGSPSAQAPGGGAPQAQGQSGGAPQAQGQGGGPPRAQAQGGGPPRGSQRPDFAGSPETVIRQLRESSEQVGWGFLDCLFTSPGMPFELAQRSVELFTSQVMPALRG